MSKVKIQGNASGTGVLTITAPNTSTDRTITLPDTTGTLLDENSSVPAANLTGTIADARFPATLPAASAANLTAIPAANITGALPAISGASLTNLPAASGTVKQIVQHSNATETNISDGNFHVTNTVALAAPASSSSVYLIWAKMQCTIDSGERCRYKLTRTDSGGTYDVHYDSNYLFSHDSGSTVRMNAPLVFYLAAPNALAQTFKLQAQNTSGTISVMEAGNINILTVQEIGAL